MRLVTENDNKVLVRILQASRDAKTNRMTYETFDTIEVAESKCEEVFATCKEAIIRKSSGK